MILDSFRLRGCLIVDHSLQGRSLTITRDHGSYIFIRSLIASTTLPSFTLKQIVFVSRWRRVFLFFVSARVLRSNVLATWCVRLLVSANDSPTSAIAQKIGSREKHSAMVVTTLSFSPDSASSLLAVMYFAPL